MREISRRTLLKGIGVGTAGIGAAALLRAATSGSPAESSKPRCAFGVHAAARAGESPEQAITVLETQVGRKFALDRQFYRWDDEFPSDYDRWTRDQGRLPLLSWAPRTVGGELVPWTEIAAGLHDDRIGEVAGACALFGSPFGLAFDHEPNNQGGALGAPPDFVAAWRRIREAFDQAGVPDVTWVWILTSFQFERGAAGELYPGDPFVDSVGVDGYNFFDCRYPQPWQSFQQVFQPAYDFATSRAKPMIIGEWGSVEDRSRPGRKAEWLRGAAATLKRWPLVKGVAYFNSAPICDWWVDTSRSSLEAFREMGQDPYFV